MSEFNMEQIILSEKDINKFTILVDGFHDAIIYLDLNGTVKSYNKGAERLYGYTEEEMIGKRVSILFPKENENEFFHIMSKINNGIGVKSPGTIRKKKNAELVTVSTTISAISGENGKLIGAICIARSMEEKQKLINKLKESEEKWRFAIEGGRFVVWDWNMITNRVHYSDRAKKMLGYDKTDIENGYDDWMHRIHKEDLNYFTDKLKRHLDGEDYIAEYRIRCEDNNYKWIRARGNIVQRDSNGKPKRMVGIFEDINEEMILRKYIQASENRLHGLYNSTDSGIALGEIILGDDGEFIDYKWLQMNNAMAKIIKDVPNKLHKRSDKWIDMFKGASLFGNSYKFNDYDKESDAYYSVNIYSPNPGQFALLITDISDIKKKEVDLHEKYEELSSVYEELTATEEELRQNYKELEAAHEIAEKANRAKSQFLANMSHELRTPLNGILGFAQLLEFTKLSNDQKESLLMIENSANNLLELINDILDLSKIEAGKAELKQEKFDIYKLIHYITRNLTILAKDKGIEIMYYLDPLISKELIGDELRLKQILNNLISNAVKFTEHGHIYFRVKQISRTLEETKLEFSVEDTGKGIEESFKKEIFNKFAQEETTYTKKYGGTGLGLAISKEYVKMMNGEIGVESEIGKGSNFHFTAVLKNVSNEDNISNEQKDPSSEKKFRNDRCILIVEDNDINLKIVSAFLKKLNYRYKCVYNGKEAIEYLEKNKTDLILMDIQMPVLNGYDTTKIIRDNEKKMGEHKVIIAMTAYAMEGDKTKFIDYGMDDYISKPFDIETLDGIISKHINKR